jgi:LysM repeat protein
MQVHAALRDNRLEALQFDAGDTLAMKQAGGGTWTPATGACEMPAHEAMTNTSKSHKRCPACGSSNPADAWECEMCGTSFSDVKAPRSVQQANAQPKAGASAPAPQPQPPAPKPSPAKPAPASAAQAQSAKPQARTTHGASAPKPAANTAAASKPTTDAFNAPIKNAGSMKKPTPLYASKPRFGLGSLVALVFVAAFGIAAIMFGMNALQNNVPAAPAQPIAVTLDATSAVLALPTETSVAPAVLPAATAAPTDAPTALATEAPIEAPAIVPTVAPPATATVEPTTAPSPTPAQKPSATPRATSTPAATATVAATTAPIGTGETVSYTVKGGDTCGAIAKRLGITVAQIIQQNKLDERCFLNVNQVLTITK